MTHAGGIAPKEDARDTHCERLHIFAFQAIEVAQATAGNVITATRPNKGCA